MIKKYNLTQNSDYLDVLTHFGGEAYLKEKFPMMYAAIQKSHERNADTAAVPAENGETMGLQDILTINLTTPAQGNDKNDEQPLMELYSHYNYIQKKAAVVIDTSIVDSEKKPYGGDTYVFEAGYKNDISDAISGIIMDKSYELHGKSDFSSFIMDKSGVPVLDSFEIREDNISTYIPKGTKVVDSVTPIDPKNSFPQNIAQTYIVYGKRSDNYMSYQYKDVPDPIIIGGQKYASIWCPVKIIIKLNGFIFFHDEPLSNTDFSISLESSEPDKYGGGGIIFNNDFSKITKTLSENDTVLTIELPVDWAAKLTINDINLVIGSFDFRACFKVNYVIDIGGQKVTRMAAITAATNVVLTSSSAYVEPLKIRWGCFGRKSSVQTKTGKKSVADIQAGEYILAADGSYVKVTDITTGHEKSIVTIQLTENGDILQLSDAHGLQTKRGLIPAGDLRFEDELLTADDSYQNPFYLSLDTYEDTVYNIETENHAMFFASGVVVSDKENMEYKNVKNEEVQKLPPEFMDELKRWTEEKRKEKGITG